MFFSPEHRIKSIHCTGSCQWNQRQSHTSATSSSPIWTRKTSTICWIYTNRWGLQLLFYLNYYFHSDSWFYSVRWKYSTWLDLSYVEFIWFPLLVLVGWSTIMRPLMRISWWSSLLTWKMALPKNFENFQLCKRTFLSLFCKKIWCSPHWNLSYSLFFMSRG